MITMMNYTVLLEANVKGVEQHEKKIWVSCQWDPNEASIQW